MNYFNADPDSAFDAKAKAQFLSFAPIAFQATRVLRKFGILAAIQASGKKGISLSEIQRQVPNQSPYGIKVLVEAGLGIGLIYLREQLFYLTKTGFFVLSDEMTRVNMDFTHDVCYRGMFNLEDSITQGQPSGLKNLGEWKTVYEGLPLLPPQVKTSWFNFDHFYSDVAFPKALPEVFKRKPKRILDVGGNTGKWAMACTAYDPDVKVTIADLPGQIAMAETNIKKNGLSDRIDGFGMDLLNPNQSFPNGYDAIWMSQFLDCFSMEQITSILKRAKEAMGTDTRLFILETYWDRQENATAAFCLQQTSLYFTCIANGNSQMYHSDDMKQCLAEAGLWVEKEHDQIGLYHTLTQCKNI